MLPNSIPEFQETVWEYYREHRREMPWRDDPSLYDVVVSEVMLQQTQVSRVLEKFPGFIRKVPDFSALADASVADVLREWQGMGYNRRALNLQKLAQTLMREYGGKLPDDPAELIKLPGIGPGTAGSIAAFAFNKPVVFIETNIRRVFIHHFFEDAESVSDKELMPFIDESLDREHPREWYYALMDYGTYLAKTVPNPNRRSRHHAVQPKFEGSDRQLRGAIIRLHLSRPGLATETIPSHFSGEPPERVARIVAQLIREGFLI